MDYKLNEDNTFKTELLKSLLYEETPVWFEKLEYNNNSVRFTFDKVHNTINVFYDNQSTVNIEDHLFYDIIKHYRPQYEI